MQRKILISLLMGVFFSSQSWAQMTAYGLGQMPFSGSVHEYSVGKQAGRPMITVNLLNGVAIPGVYHIPIDTSMTDLFSYAGGTIESAALDDIVVRRADNTVSRVDFQGIMKSGKPIPVLNNQDVVQFKIEKDYLARTGLILGIVSILASLTLTGLLLSDRMQGKK